MNQVIPFLLILNLLNIRQVLKGILTYGGDDAEKVGKNETEIVVPLKDLSNFWRTLDIPLINCEIELILTWFKSCILVDMAVRDAGKNDGPPIIFASTGLEF